MDNTYVKVRNWSWQCDELVDKGYQNYKATLGQDDKLDHWSSWKGRQNIENLKEGYRNFILQADTLESDVIRLKSLAERKVKLAERFSTMTLMELSQTLSDAITTPGARMLKGMRDLNDLLQQLLCKECKADSEIFKLDFLMALKWLRRDITFALDRMDRPDVKLSKQQQENFFFSFVVYWITNSCEGKLTDKALSNVWDLVQEYYSDVHCAGASATNTPDPKTPTATGPANTPGFKNLNGSSCFANAALKQIIIGLVPSDLDAIRTASTTKHHKQSAVMLAFAELAEAVIARRAGKKTVANIEKLHRDLFDRLQEFGREGQSDEAAIIRTLICQKEPQDSQEFATCMLQLLGLRGSSQELCSFESMKSTEGEKVLSRKRTHHYEPFYSIFPVGDNPLYCFFEKREEVMDGANKVVWDDVEVSFENGTRVERPKKIKLASLKTTMPGNEAPQNLRRVRVKTNPYIYDTELGGTTRSSAQPREMLYRSSHMKLPIQNTTTFGVEQIPFKIQSVVVHLGGGLVNSGHYVTLEHQNGRWYLHNDHNVKELSEGIDGYFKTHPNAVPYMFDLVRDDHASP